MHLQKIKRQLGVSLVGVLFILIILALLGILGMKIVPTVLEFNAINSAIVKAKAVGSTPAEIRSSFDKQADATYIESIAGKDLEIVKVGSDFEISFAYDKKIPLIGPASLLIEYVGSTAKTKPIGNKVEG